MHRQRGAISIIAAATLVVSVLVVALALDIGRIILEKQRLQAAADAAALAGARVLAVEGQIGAVAAAAQAAAVKNGYAGNVATENAVQVGHLESLGGARSFKPGARYTSAPYLAAPYAAVRVTTTRSVPRSLVASGLLTGDVRLSAEAVGYQEAFAVLKVGSSLASVDTARSELFNSVLGTLLGTSLSVSAAAYDDLVGANLQLGDLLVGLGVGGNEQLTDINVRLAQILDVMADVLPTGGLAAVTLNNMAASIGWNPQLTLGELLAVGNHAAALEAQVNAFDLLMAAAQLANQGRTVGVDLSTAGTLLSTLNLADIDLQLRVVQAPQLAAGPPGRNPVSGEWYTRARSGQVDLQLSLKTLQVNLLGLLTTSVELDLFLGATSAEAWLAAIEPANPTKASHVSAGTHTELARLGIGKRSGGTVTPSTLVDIHVPLLLDLKVTAVTDIPLGAESNHSLEYDGPFVPTLETPSAANTRSVGTALGPSLRGGVGGLLGSSNLVVDLDILSILPISLNTTAVTQALGGTIDPLLDTLAINLLEPLLSLIGLQIGGADVTVLHASAGEVRLVQ